MPIDTSLLHFIRPWWLLAFLPLLAYIVWYWFFQGHKNDWQRYLDAELAQYVLLRGAEGKSRKWLYAVCIFIASSLVILALAGPAWEKVPQLVFKNKTAIVAVLDLSRSMDSIDLKPSRLVRAKQKLNDLLQLNKGGQMALIVYAADAYVVTPLTDDINTIATHIPNLSTDIVRVQGSRPDRALEKAQQLLQQAHIRRGQVVLIADAIELNKQNKQAAENLAKSGHRLSIIGVGTAEGAPIASRQSQKGKQKTSASFVTDQQGNIVIPKLDINSLRQIAKIGGGGYANLTVDDLDIKRLNIQPVDNQGVENAEDDASQRSSDAWRDMGGYLLLLVIPLLLLGFQRGVLFSLCLSVGMLLPAEQGYAFELPSIFLNQDQQAKRAFDQQQYDKAGEQFTQAEWQASAAYKQGDYEQAIKALEDNDHPQALYNKGNAHAKSGNLQQAIEHYEASLKAQPDNPDAQHNLELVKKMLEQQQNQQQQNQQNDENQDSESEQSDSQQNEQGQQDQQENSQQDNSQQQESDDDQQQNSDQSSQNQQDQQQPSEQQQSDQESEQQNAEKSEGDQQQSEDEAEQQQTQAEQQGEQTEESTEQKTEQAAEMAEADAEDQEQQQLQQWLRRVEDDPGGLLRRKFQYQDYINKQEAEKQQW